MVGSVINFLLVCAVCTLYLRPHSRNHTRSSATSNLPAAVVCATFFPKFGASCENRSDFGNRTAGTYVTLSDAIDVRNANLALSTGKQVKKSGAPPIRRPSAINFRLRRPVEKRTFCRGTPAPERGFKCTNSQQYIGSTVNSGRSHYGCVQFFALLLLKFTTR